MAHAVCGAGAGWPNPRIDLPNPGSSGRGLGLRVQSLEGLGLREGVQTHLRPSFELRIFMEVSVARGTSL